MKYKTLVPYTSALPNAENQKILDQYFLGWRFVLSPASIRSFGKNREHILYSHGYGLDNGAYSYWKRDLPFPTERFLMCIEKYGDKADWIVLPDVIQNWVETQEFSDHWYNKLKGINNLLIVAQNGCEENNYKELNKWIERGCGVFVGGDDDFKSNHSKQIVDMCRKNNLICHIGRVNSIKRMEWCHEIGAFSFDGSGMSRFREQARFMSRHVAWIHTDKINQLPLFGEWSEDTYYQTMQKKYFKGQKDEKSIKIV